MRTSTLAWQIYTLLLGLIIWESQIHILITGENPQQNLLNQMKIATSLINLAWINNLNSAIRLPKLTTKLSFDLPIKGQRLQVPMPELHVPSFEVSTVDTHANPALSQLQATVPQLESLRAFTGECYVNS